MAEHGARGGTGQTGGGALESGNWGEWGNTRAGLCNSISSSFQPPGVVIKGSRAITKRNARCQRAEDALLIYLFSSLDFYLHGHWHVSGMEWNGKEERSSWVTLGCFSGGFRGGAEGELLQHPDAVCYLLFVKVLRARLFGARAKCQIGLMALMRIRVETKPTTNRTTNQPTNQAHIKGRLHSYTGFGTSFQLRMQMHLKTGCSCQASVICIPHSHIHIHVHFPLSTHNAMQIKALKKLSNLATNANEC